MYYHLTALPEHSLAAQQLLTSGAALHFVLIIAFAPNTTTLAFRVSMAFQRRPHTLALSDARVFARPLGRIVRCSCTKVHEHDPQSTA